ncbi:ComEA family DNA-binding protein [Vibrio sp. 16]|uniref:ComEA family DNA-binding protein n=1 Tax=Vibrio sp. 16 TaxID=391586 RepID=UPI002FF22B18
MLVLSLPQVALADQKVNPEYEGIEITVNVNQASAEELADLLTGIGMKKAQAIVDYREKHGDFESTESLVDVKGIGPALVDKNRERIQL